MKPLLLALALLGGCRSSELSVTGLDAAADLTSSTGDLAQPGVSCGSMSCGADQVCVHLQCADCVPPNDLGACSDGFSFGGCPTAGVSCVGPYHDVSEPFCGTIAAACTSTRPCDCYEGTACGCDPENPRAVQCLCY